MECIIIVREKPDQSRDVCIIFDQANLDALAREESEYLYTFGMDITGDGELLPESCGQPTVILGGDAPILFMHLAEFTHQYPNFVPDYPKWKRGIRACLWPTKKDEHYGILGAYDGDGCCSVHLFPSKEDGLHLLRSQGGSQELKAALKKSSLPKKSELSIVVLPTALSEWFVTYYGLYQASTGNVV